MKEVKHFLVSGTAVALGFFLTMFSGSSVFSQVPGIDRSGEIEVIKDNSLRKSDPQRVIKAIEEVTAPYRARPVTSTEPIPAEIVSALLDLLDFEIPGSGNPDFDITAGQKVYPVMRALTEMRAPVLTGLIGVVEEEDTASVRSSNAVAVIRRILGDDVNASDYFRVNASASKTETGKQRLLSAAETVTDEHQKFQNWVEN